VCGNPSLTVFSLSLADAAERTNAEQQLAHAAEVDFVCDTLPSFMFFPLPCFLGVITRQLRPPLDLPQRPANAHRLYFFLGRLSYHTRPRTGQR
jgi:hypothetical protein